jgi:hypothetical protein
MPIDAQFDRAILDRLSAVSAHLDDEVLFANFDAAFDWKLAFENVLDSHHVSFVHTRPSHAARQAWTAGRREVAVMPSDTTTTANSGAEFRIHGADGGARVGRGMSASSVSGRRAYLQLVRLPQRQFHQHRRRGVPDPAIHAGRSRTDRIFTCGSRPLARRNAIPRRPRSCGRRRRARRP